MMASRGANLLRVASWNIHDARGSDGRRDLSRISAVIAQLDVPVLALQEIRCGADGGDAARLAARHGYACHAIATFRSDEAEHGNALLTTLPVERVRTHDLSVPQREPRVAIEADVLWHGLRVRFVATHLGLRAGERRQQVRSLLAGVRPEGAFATVLLGDINEWWLWGRPLRWLHRRFGHTPSVRTYPARMPLLALDRVWAHPQEVLATVTAVHVAGTRQASDHLPVVAALRLREPGQRSADGE